MQPEVPPALQIRGMSKTFGAQRALRELSLTVRQGEVHALVGQNGSGKSTLVKCLAGYHDRDPDGEVRVGDRLLPSSYGPQQAASLGLSFVHQDLGLVPTLTVAANLHLGERGDTAPGWRVRRRHEMEVTAALLARLGRPDIDPGAYVRDLSSSTRAVVAIARCLHKAADAPVVVLDEPTAPLAQLEVDRLLDAVRRIAEEGHGVVYISHRLSEVFALADRVTVLRDGQRVATLEVADTTEEELAELMLGRPLVRAEPAAARPGQGEVVLRATDISGKRVQGVSFELCRGEIVGLAGLQGCGKSELGRLLFGDQVATGGSLVLGGEPVRLTTPSDAVRLGIAMVPANRHRDGVHLAQSLADNVTMLDLRRFFRFAVMRDRERIRVARALVERYDVRPADPHRLMSQLSGGNQQKAVLAKWMHRAPTLMVLDEPAQAMDVGAKAKVYALLQEAAQDGMALLVISEEFEDMADLCDRVLVMREGRVVAALTGATKTAENIAELVYRRTDAA